MKITNPAAPVGIVMGSISDWEHMIEAARTLKQFAIPFDTQIVSAHRTPDKLFEYAETAEGQGVKVIIAGAGGAAHLPGMLAAKTKLPILGVPMPTATLSGMDSLYSIVQMPKGVPVATFAIGKAGAINAALFAVSILALQDEIIAEQLADFRQQQTDDVMNINISHENI